MMNVMMGMSGRCKKTVGQRFLQTWVKQEGQGPGLSMGKFLASRLAQSKQSEVETLLNQVFPAQNPFSFQAEIHNPCDSSASKFPGLLHHSTGLPIPLPSNVEEISVMNRNARRPKRANHGARPCSRSSRRFKKEKIGKRRRG